MDPNTEKNKQTPTPEPAVTPPEHHELVITPLSRPPEPAAATEPTPSPNLSQPAPTVTPVTAPAATPIPAEPEGPVSVVVGTVAPEDPNAKIFVPNNPGASPPPFWRKKPVLFGAPVLIIMIAGLGFYFGVYNSPSYVYSQSLSNTGKGLTKLSDYLNDQDKLGYKGYTGEGSYKFNQTGGASSDGKLSLKGSGDNGEFTFDVGLGVGRVTSTIRSLKSGGTTPDLYVQASGIKGLGSLIGTPEYDAELAKLDGNWVAIDHTLLDNLASTSGAASTMKNPTQAQIQDEINVASKVNQQYLFSTKQDKAVLKIVKTIGSERVDEHSTVHYVVAFQPDNVKKYINAQQAALKTSKLNDWIKANKYESTVDSSFKELAASTKDIKSSDTFDLWMDKGNRIVYKIRISDKNNAAANYADLGLNYKGGDSFPFFLNFHTKSASTTTDVSLGATLNTKTSETAFNLKATSMGDDAFNATANFTFKPTNSVIKIEKPATSIPVSQVLSDLGYGDVLHGLQAAPAADGSVNSGIQEKAHNSKRQTDIQALQTQLEAFYSQNGYYPSLKDMNSATWRKTNMKSLDETALIDPSSASQSGTLVATPAAKVYAYQVSNSAGASCEVDDKTCAKYMLTATYEGNVDGAATYNKQNLN